jgi:hypothetical protein
LGAFFDSIPRSVLEQTVIIVAGDNGTPSPIMSSAVTEHDKDVGSVYGECLNPAERFKHSVWEGGVRAPLWVSGPMVAEPGRESEALVDAVDLFATIAELCGADARSVVPAERFLDGVSFVPLLRAAHADADHARTFSLVERFEPNGNPERIEYDEGDMSLHHMRRTGFVLETEEGRFKLVRNWDASHDPGDRLFQLTGADGSPRDPWERAPLATEAGSPWYERYREVAGALAALHASETRNFR